jgi:hypothetical protein
LRLRGGNKRKRAARTFASGIELEGKEPSAVEARVLEELKDAHASGKVWCEVLRVGSSDVLGTLELEPLELEGDDDGDDEADATPLSATLAAVRLVLESNRDNRAAFDSQADRDAAAIEAKDKRIHELGLELLKRAEKAAEELAGRKVAEGRIVLLEARVRELEAMPAGEASEMGQALELLLPALQPAAAVIGAAVAAKLSGAQAAPPPRANDDGTPAAPAEVLRLAVAEVDAIATGYPEVLWDHRGEVIALATKYRGILMAPERPEPATAGEAAA